MTRGQSSTESLLLLAAYVAFVLVLSLAFKEYALATFTAEAARSEQRLAGRECFFEEVLVLGVRNAAANVPRKCGVESGVEEPA